jgi:hypothetical protein
MNQKALNRQKNEHQIINRREHRQKNERLTLRKLNIENTESQNAKRDPRATNKRALNQ